jgi:hypothetical protein
MYCVMRTSQTIYFVLLIVTALIWIEFGSYPILVIAAVYALLWLWSRLRHPREWKGNGFAVRVEQGFREEAWVQYEEDGRKLSLRATWSGAKQNFQLSVQIDEKVYFPPDHANALSEPRIAEIQGRVSEGLKHLKIRHAFERMAGLAQHSC